MFEFWRELRTEEDALRQGELFEAQAAIHIASGNHRRALSLQHAAMHIWRNAGEHEREARTAHAIGRLYLCLNDYAAAIAAYKRALDLHAHLNDHLGMGLILARAAEVHWRLGHEQKATDLLEVAQWHWRKYLRQIAGHEEQQDRERSRLAGTTVEIAAILSDAGMHTPAYEMLIMARKIQTELPADQARHHTLRLLVQVCQLQGKQEEALLFQQAIDAAG